MAVHRSVRPAPASCFQRSKDLYSHPLLNPEALEYRCHLTVCLAIPARIVEKKGDHAKVDFGDGVTREANISLVDVAIGDYVIVHAGFAIEVLDHKEAKETLKLWEELLSV
jgi:hydrogenase expression/formation protein HypC